MKKALLSLSGRTPLPPARGERGCLGGEEGFSTYFSTEAK
jgi:hypothetical protein